MANGPAVGRRKVARGASPADQFFELAHRTMDDAGDSGLDGPVGGQQDAYRHALWTSRMKDRYGAAGARVAGVAHEAVGAIEGIVKDGSVPIRETLMDLKNNEVGLRVAGEINEPAEREARLKQMALEANEPQTFSEAWRALFDDRLVKLPRQATQ